MSKTNCILLFSLLACATASAQFLSVKGIITNTKMEPLAFASIQVKETQLGTVSRADGTYELKLDEGKYDIVVSMMGYKSQLLTIVVKANMTRNILMEPGVDKGMQEVIVKAKSKDRAEEFIRNIIRHKDSLLMASGAYSCQMYIRALQKDSVPGKTRKGIKSDSLKAGMNAMAMAEISLRYDQSISGQVRETREGVSKRGNAEALFYLSATEGDFNLYNNLIASRVLATIPFISPASYSGLLAYRYKTVRFRTAGHHRLYSISFRPKQVSNATIEGEIEIDDSSWTILHAVYRLPPYHLPGYDFFEVEQQYDYIQQTAWMITRQVFTYYSKEGKGKRSGQTIVSNNNFELRKSFPKGYFGNEVSATAQQAYQRDSSFWQQTRTEPLSAEEIRFIRYKDSVYDATHTKQYLDSMDRLINHVNWKNVTILGQNLHYHETGTTWVLPSLLSLYQPLNLGGARINPNVFYDRIYDSKKTINIHADISYGLRNKDVNGSVQVTRMYNPFNRAFYSFSAGREFNAIFAGDAWINQLKRSNVYLNSGIGAGYGIELLNGLYLYSNIDIAFRRSVAGYKTNPLVDSLFGSILTDNQAVEFSPYNAVYGKISLQYTPQQKYIREPLEKVILGSAWPTFYVTFRKGISGVLNSPVNFNYLEFGMKQMLQLGTLGVTRYSVLSGSFLTRSDLRLVDYKFERRGDPILFLNPNEAFQSLDSTFPVFSRFYEAHLVHEFNGFFINKIPLLKKLQLRETAGAGFLIAPERNLRYAEAFAGIERVFRWPFQAGAKFKLGIYAVGAVANQFHHPIQIKIGITAWDRSTNQWK